MWRPPAEACAGDQFGGSGSVSSNQEMGGRQRKDIEGLNVKGKPATGSILPAEVGGKKGREA